MSPEWSPDGYFGWRQARCGTVTFVQRFGSALNLDVHCHVLISDSAWVPESRPGSPTFQLVQGPSTDDVENLVVQVADACERFLAETEGACVGTSVAYASDVDADGRVDLVLGAGDNSEGGLYAGAAYLILFADMP